MLRPSICSVMSLVFVLYALSPAQLKAQSGSRGGGTIIRRGTVIQGGSSAYRPGSSTQTYQGSGSVTRQAALTFEQKFWKYLDASHYRQWAPVPGTTGDSYAGESPHGAKLRMYLNRTAVGRPSELPYSSIIVKENYGPDGETLMAITVMYKTKGYNAGAGDWYWIKYLPGGRVDQKQTESGMMKLSGKPKGCIECHAGADGGDYVFFNDGL